MSLHRMRVCAMAAASLTAMVSAETAQAGAFGLREQSAAGQGASFAGAAAGAAGLGSMFWNPSAITMNPGLQTETDMSLILPRSDFTAGSASSPLYQGSKSGDVAQDAFLPASYGSWQINDRFWIGGSITTPFGLVTKPDASFPGRTYGDTTKVMSVNVTPTIGYKVNDWLSVGAGVQLMYFKARYMSALAPSAAAPVAGLDGDSYGIGYTLGMTLTPVAGTTIGLGFRSAVQEDLEGDFQSPAGLTPFKARAVLPEQVTVGLRQVINDRFTLLAGAEWTNWSRIRFPRVYNANTGAPLAGVPVLPLGYRDGWFTSIGGEYRVSDALTLRTGLAYEHSPIRTDVRTLRLADNDRIWASLGASYQWNQKLTLDLGYTHIFVKETKVNIVEGNPSWSAGRGNLVGTVDGRVDIVSIGLRYRWDDTSKTIPASQPAVAKK